MNKSNKPLTKSQARAGLIFLLCLLAFYICLNISITTIQKRIRSHCEENPSKVDVSQYLNEHDSGTAFVFSPKDNTNCSYIIFEILCGGKSATYYFYRSGSWIIIREKGFRLSAAKTVGTTAATLTTTQNFSPKLELGCLRINNNILLPMKNCY